MEGVFPRSFHDPRTGNVRTFDFRDCLMAAPLQDEQSRYVVKTSSKIEFHASSTFAKVVGVFHSWEADMKMPADKFADASLVLEIEAASVTTGSGLRDKEVKGKNFFAVQEHPKIRFRFEEHYRRRRLPRNFTWTEN